MFQVPQSRSVLTGLLRELLTIYTVLAWSCNFFRKLPSQMGTYRGCPKSSTSLVVWQPQTGPEIIQIIFLYVYSDVAPCNLRATKPFYTFKTHDAYHMKTRLNMKGCHKPIKQMFFLVTLHSAGHFNIIFWHGAPCCTFLSEELHRKMLF